MKPVAIVQIDFTSPAESVFDAWLTPESISKWMFGPALRDENVLHVEINPAIGGTFSFLVDRQGVKIDHVGVYTQIERPDRLEFSWAIGEIKPDDSRVLIEISPSVNGCRLQLKHTLQPDWAEYLERTQNSWVKMLDVLKKVLD